MSDKIKVSEQFASIQGEGKYTGVLSVFLRTYGCNFKCAGFGMSTDSETKTPLLSTEPDEIAKGLVGRLDGDDLQYDELPLASTGCDSYASWHPKFKKLSPIVNVTDLANQLSELFTVNDYNANTFKHLVITGGEPLLGWQRSYPLLLTELQAHGFTHITFETNGTQELSNDFKEYLKTTSLVITFSVSPKLLCSGESINDALKPDIVASYETYGETYLKFVVTGESDLADITQFVDEYRLVGFNGDVYVMPMGGLADEYNFNVKEVAKLAMEYNFIYSPRMHIDLFGNAWGT